MTGTVTGVPVAQTKIVIASPDLPDGPSRRALQGFGETCAEEIEHGGPCEPRYSPKHQVIDIKASNEICFDT